MNNVAVHGKGFASLTPGGSASSSSAGQQSGDQPSPVRVPSALETKASGPGVESSPSSSQRLVTRGPVNNSSAAETRLSDSKTIASAQAVRSTADLLRQFMELEGDKLPAGAQSLINDFLEHDEWGLARGVINKYRATIHFSASSLQLLGLS